MAKLHFFYLTMNAGKSTSLLQSNHNYLESNLKTLLFLPEEISKKSDSSIVSRIGLKAKAISINNVFKFYEYLEKADYKSINCIFVDEAQFLTKLQVRDLSKIADEEFNKSALYENYKNILSIMSPIMPHLMFECLETLKLDVFQNWPEIDKKMLENKTIDFVIQINGKKKVIMKVKKDINEKTVMELLKKDDKINKNFKNKKIDKVFFVKNRLINILLE